MVVKTARFAKCLPEWQCKHTVSPLLFGGQQGGIYRGRSIKRIMVGERIFVFRLGHRIGRDERASTHLLLAARALGARKVFYSGEKDSGLEGSLERLKKRWGGGFEVEYVGSGWRAFLKKWKAGGMGVVHLTMYGQRIGEVMAEIKKMRKDLLVVVGGAKVPGEVFSLADFNMAVGNQPHSEISALAVFLDRFFEGGWEGGEFAGAGIVVTPNKMGKSIKECKK